jgi:GDP-D-mannose dehydratase
MDAKSNEPLISIDPRYFRPTEVELLLGDPALPFGEYHRTMSHSLYDVNRNEGGTEFSVGELPCC